MCHESSWYLNGRIICRRFSRICCAAAHHGPWVKTRTMHFHRGCSDTARLLECCRPGPQELVWTRIRTATGVPLHGKLKSHGRAPLASGPANAISLHPVSTPAVGRPSGLHTRYFARQKNNPRLHGGSTLTDRNVHSRVPRAHTPTFICTNMQRTHARNLETAHKP